MDSLNYVRLFLLLNVRKNKSFGELLSKYVATSAQE